MPPPPALHEFGRTHKRLVESLLDGWLASRDKRDLIGIELLSRLMELLAGQSPAPEPLRNDTDVRAVQPLHHARLALALVDHRRVVLADQLVFVQLLYRVQAG